MTTHQELTGSSDHESVERYASSYPARFTDAYWAAFDRYTQPRLPEHASGADLGCGPALFLQQVAKRIPGSTLYGYDVTPAMLEYARILDFGASTTHFAVADLSNAPIPLSDQTLDFVAVTQVLHLFPDPLRFLAEVRRVLKSAGMLLLYDFVRTSFSDYVYRPNLPLDKADGMRRRFMDLYPYRNKYSVEDWEWILSEFGFEILSIETPRENFNRLFIAVKSEP